jgi:hypothetical protein
LRPVAVSKKDVRLVKTLGIASLATTLMAQEQVPVRFDPRGTGELDLDWLHFLLATGVALIGVSAWWWFTRFIERNRSRIPWRALLYWWPTLSAAGLIALRFAGNGLPEALLAGILVPYVIVNLPGVVGTAVVYQLLDGKASPLLVGAIACAAMWLLTHGTIRVLEWRAWVNVPVLLDLHPRD